MKKNMWDISEKNTPNFNYKILQENLKQNKDCIDEGYAEYLISRLELMKDKSKKSCGLIKQKGFKIYDDINKKEYLSINEAVRETGLKRNEITKSINNNEPIIKVYRFKQGDNNE